MKFGTLKKWLLLILLAVFCAFIVAYVEIPESIDRQVIYLRGGEPVLADIVSQSDQFVFYEVDGKSGMFMKDDVASIGSIKVEKMTSLLLRLDRNKRRLLENAGINRRVSRMLDSRLLIFVVVLALSAAIFNLASLIAARAKRRRPQLSQVNGNVPAADNRTPFTQEGQEPSDLRDIALFFLELYRLQNGLGKDAPARFSMTAESARRKMKVFELGVKGSNDWLIRRMSVGPLGEDTGSKSKCFYVIYDTHMVVKIPPVPVTDMVRYVKDIRREVQIAVQLAPVACIVPMVSVVLKKVKTLPYASSLTQEQLEKQYIRLVEEHPDYQEYLKIGDHFAFFMELSNSFFLGRVIDELHASKTKTGDELRESPDVAWDQAAFTTRYGLASLPVFAGLQSLYRDCEAKAREIIKGAGQGDQIHTFQIKKWFLAAIAREQLSHTQEGVNEALLRQIRDGFTDVFKANSQKIDGLIGLLKKEIAAKAFLKNRRQIENIASNMLQLLVQLKEKRIALRDLKPDNLFLDADPDNYPMFLKRADNFSIGVIDVETAVSLIPQKDGTINQPVLGGTPLYATPLHVLKNATLSNYFGNLPEILHLQDWLATTAIIFKAITGRNLFPRAARSFPAVLKILKSGGSKTDPSEATVKAMGRKYWSAAAADIKSHLISYAGVLNQLTLSVPPAMVPAIKAELERECTCLQTAIRKHVAASPLFKSDSNRAYLVNASRDAIAKQIEKWVDEQNLPAAHRPAAPRMVSLLKNLNRLKQGEADKRRAIEAVTHPPHGISAYSLLEAMFQIVFIAMYKSRWNAVAKRSDEDSDQAVAEKDDRTMVTAILNEN